MWLFAENGVLATNPEILSTPKSIGFVSGSRDIFYFLDDSSNYDYYIPKIITPKKIKKNSREKDRFFPENNSTDVAIYNALKLCQNGGVAIYIGKQKSIVTVLKRIIELQAREVDFSPFLVKADEIQLEKLSNFFSEYYGIENICTSGRVISERCRCPNVGRRLTSNIREYSLNVEGLVVCSLSFSQSWA